MGGVCDMAPTYIMLRNGSTEKVDTGPKLAAVDCFIKSAQREILIVQSTSHVMFYQNITQAKPVPLAAKVDFVFAVCSPKMVLCSRSLHPVSVTTSCEFKGNFGHLHAGGESTET